MLVKTKCFSYVIIYLEENQTSLSGPETDYLSTGIFFTDALDILYVLSYMHEICIPCFLHYDIKQINILQLMNTILICRSLDWRRCYPLVPFLQLLGLLELMGSHSMLRQAVFLTKRMLTDRISELLILRSPCVKTVLTLFLGRVYHVKHGVEEFF